MGAFDLLYHVCHIDAEKTWPKRFEFPQRIAKMFIRAVKDISMQLMESGGNLNQPLKKEAAVLRMSPPHFFPRFM
jgi:hypothetical protein